MKTIPGKAVLLCSGGLDSTAAWVVLGFPPTLHFRFDTPYAAIEEEHYRTLMAAYKQPATVVSAFSTLRPLGRGRELEELPLRNLLMCMTAWAMGWDTVILNQVNEWGPDKRWWFAVTAAYAARTAFGGSRPFRVVRPFRYWTKSRLVKAAVAASPADPLWYELLYSCYSGSPIPCGQCHICRRAMVAYAAAGLEPPYVTWLPTWAGWSWATFLEWTQGDAPRWWAPGSLVFVPFRLRELWKAWKAVQR